MNMIAMLRIMILLMWHSSGTVSVASSSRRRLDDSSEAGIGAELKYHVSKSWNVTRKFGQITAVALNAAGHVVIFHRGTHMWDQNSFNDEGIYIGKSEGPIAEETIYELDQQTGSELKKWGQNFFYLPHGLSIDSDGNHWLTDVAMHQIFKFGPSGGEKSMLTLGEAFSPGSDSGHFCKPTSVAVHSRTKEIFVADGYCNSRLMKFSASGQFIGQWGYSGSSPLRIVFNFRIPHKVILIESKNEACVSDRENGMIKCLDITKPNKPTARISNPSWNRLFSISFAKCSPIDMFFAVNGPSLQAIHPGASAPVQAFAVSYEEQQIVSYMAPPDVTKNIYTFHNPHDIVSTKDCKNIFVVEIGPNVIWKFMTDFFGHNPDNMTTMSLISENLSPEKNVHSTQILGSFTILMFSFLTLVVVVVVLMIRASRHHSRSGIGFHFLRRGMSNNRDSFDLGRLLEDPEKSGFNRVSTHDVDADNDGDLSDSEVEEFNVSNVRNGLKV